MVKAVASSELGTSSLLPCGDVGPLGFACKEVWAIIRRLPGLGHWEPHTHPQAYERGAQTDGPVASTRFRQQGNDYNADHFGPPPENFCHHEDAQQGYDGSDGHPPQRAGMQVVPSETGVARKCRTCVHRRGDAKSRQRLPHHGGPYWRRRPRVCLPYDGPLLSFTLDVLLGMQRHCGLVDGVKLIAFRRVHRRVVITILGQCGLVNR